MRTQCASTSSSCFPSLIKTLWERREDRTGKRPGLSVTMTTTTSGPFLFKAHLSSTDAKFVPLSLRPPALSGECGEEEAHVKEPGTLPFGAPVRHFRWPEVGKGNRTDGAPTGQGQTASALSRLGARGRSEGQGTPASPPRRPRRSRPVRQHHQGRELAVPLPQGPRCAAAVGPLRAGQ